MSYRRRSDLKAAAATTCKSGVEPMTAIIICMLATVLGLWPTSVFAEGEHLTVKSWTACPTIEVTHQMLLVLVILPFVSP
jgi:hypothetical protein